MADVRLDAVTKSFGALHIIKGVDLDIRTGEFVVFVGPSGCGKSTLLRLIAGLEPITSGTLAIGGVRMNDVDPSKRGIAMVFQSYALYPHLTVRQNIGLALRISGMAKAEVERQVMEAARILDLEALLDRKPKALSGGQRQRVAIGRAIVRHPKVFLFDEPLSNLDAELRVHMRVEIAKLHRRLGATTIYVTHDQVEAMTLAEKIVILRAGRIEQVGSPLHLYDDPDNTFVAGFIGSPRMNLIAAEVADGGTLVLPGFGNARIPVGPRAPALATGQRVTVGIRPDWFAEDGTAALRLPVEVVEHLGASSFIHAGTGEADTLIVEMKHARGVQPGTTIDVRFDPARLLYFDVSGQRLR